MNKQNVWFKSSINTKKQTPLDWMLDRLKFEAKEKNFEYMNKEQYIPIFNGKVKNGYFIKKLFDDCESIILNEGFYLNNSNKCLNEVITFCRKNKINK